MDFPSTWPFKKTVQEVGGGIGMQNTCMFHFNVWQNPLQLKKKEEDSPRFWTLEIKSYLVCKELSFIIFNVGYQGKRGH